MKEKNEEITHNKLIFKWAKSSEKKRKAMTEKEREREGGKFVLWVKASYVCVSFCLITIW